MAKQLVVIAGPDKGRAFTLSGNDTLLIGRSKATQTILTDPHVSRVHCQVECEGGQVLLLDNESAAGTFVNGKRVSQHALRPGDVIKIGETQLRYQDEDVAENQTVVAGQAKPAAAPAVKLEDLTGKTISHYEVGELLARGQTGHVFLAKDTKEDRTVALKVLRPEFSKNEEDMQRFVRGMKTMMPLRHPNLVALYGAGKTGPYCWIAMEYVEGESLTQVIQRIGTAGMLDWRNALRYGVHVGRALDFAAQHKILHRNLTPNNVLVRSSDKVAKLGDLMLAKALEGSMAQQVTGQNTMVGDILYMSPERARGTADVDERSDIFSLGALVYHLLTGRPPFTGDTLADTILAIRNADPVKPKKYQLAIPDLFEGAVLRMLAKRPEDRFQTPGEMVAELERVAKYSGTTV